MKSEFSLLEPMEDVLGWWKNHKDHVHYDMQEEILQNYFNCIYPDNNDMKEIMVKACLLNDFYSTKVFNIYVVTERIYNLKDKIKERLDSGCYTLVNEIAGTVKKNGKIEQRGKYSFATKYCSFHCPENYPIYDEKVKNMLVFFKKNHEEYRNKSEFKDAIPDTCEKEASELWCYETFYKVMEEFRKYHELKNESIKEVDKFLWMAGKYKWKFDFSKEKISAIPPS